MRWIILFWGKVNAGHLSAYDPNKNYTQKETAGIKREVQYGLNGKTLATAAGAGGVGVVEMKTFAVEAAGKLKRGVEEIEETFQVGDDPHAIVFKYLIVRL